MARYDAHAVPGGPGSTKRPKKPADPARDRPSEPGHGTPPTSTPPLASNPAPGRDFPGDSGHGSDPGRGSRYAGGLPAAVVIRRQEILRRTGYGVRVDGEWGRHSQNAWAAFQKSIDPARIAGQLHHIGVPPAPPPGYVYRDGVLVSRTRSAGLDALDGARQAMSAIERNRNDVARGIQRSARRAMQRKASDALVRSEARHFDAEGNLGQKVQPGEKHFYEKTGRSTHPAAVLARAKTAAYLRAGQEEAAQGERDQLAYIFGTPHEANWSPSVEVAVERGRVTPHSLALLVRDGYIDPADASDVRAVQKFVNQHVVPAGKIEVTGEWDTATNDGLTHLMAVTAANDYERQVGQVHGMLYGNGAGGEIAVIQTFGRPLGAAAVLRILQQGGAQADRLVKNIGREQLQLASMRDFEHRRQDWARTVLATRGVYVKGDISPAQLRAAYSTSGVVGRIWAVSRNDADLARYASTYRDQQMKLAAAPQGDPGFWGDLFGPIVDGFSEIGAGLSATGITGLLSPATSGASAGLDWARTMTQRGVLTWDALERHGWEDGDWLGIRTISDEWQQSRLTNDELHRAGGLNALLWDAVVDPVNLIPLGLVGKGGGLALEGLAGTGWRSIDLLEAKAGPMISDGAYAAMRGSAARLERGIALPSKANVVGALSHAVGHDLASVFDAQAKVWKTMSMVKADAIRAVNTELHEALTDSIRRVDSVKMLRAAGLGHKLVADLALRSAQHRSALGPFLDEAERLGDEHTAALKAVAPDFVGDLLEVPTSLYAAPGSRSTLSFAGRRIEALLLERSSRSILARYSIIEELLGIGDLPADVAATLGKRSLGDLRQLLVQERGLGRERDLLEQAGSWLAGGVPERFNDQYLAELRIFTGRLREQVLPALADLLLERHGAAIYEQVGDEIRLVDEAGDVVRGKLDELFGFSVDEAYSEEALVEVVNPNYLVSMPAAEMTSRISQEIGRAGSSMTSYVEMMERIGGSGRDWHAWMQQKLNDLRTTLDEAYRPRADGEWVDTRRMLLLPAPTARGVDLTVESLAHQQAAALVDALTDFTHLPRVELQRGGIGDARDLLDVVTSGTVPADAWQQFADASSRLEAVQAVASDRLVSSLYLKRGLLLDALHEQAARPWRALYFAFVGGINFWKFAALALRPAFVVRNVLDNTFKAIAEGLHDPRVFYAMSGGTVKSLFQVTAIPFLMRFAELMDAVFLTDAAPKFRLLLDKFWEQHPETLDKLFAAEHIPVPAGYFERPMLSGQGIEDGRALRPSQLRRAISRTDLPADSSYARFKRTVWHLTTDVPEAWSRKSLYSSVYLKERERGLSDLGDLGADAPRIVRGLSVEHQAEYDRLVGEMATHKVAVMERQAAFDADLERVGVTVDAVAAARHAAVDDLVAAAGHTPEELAQIKMAGHDSDLELFGHTSEEMTAAKAKAVDRLIDESSAGAHQTAALKREAKTLRKAWATVSTLEHEAIEYGLDHAEARDVGYIDQARRRRIAIQDVEEKAMLAALDAVERALFNYDDVTVIGDLMKVAVPFAHFAAKNAEYWLLFAPRHPWFTYTFTKAYDDALDAHGDEPTWMRRYAPLSPLASVTDTVPGLGWMSDWLRDGAVFDPLDLSSGAMLYRFYRQGNPGLQEDAGWPFISTLVDLVGQAGWGINPFIRYAGGRLGVLNRRSWQTIFPETTVVQALTSGQWMREQLKGLPGETETGFDLEATFADPLFALITSEPSDVALQDATFDNYVNREIANQVSRGEKADRPAAERKVRAFTAFATLLGYVVGIYPRRITDDDRQLYEIGTQLGAGTLDFESDLTPKQQEAYQLFKQTVGGRSLSKAAFDRYRRGLEAARPFFALETYDERQTYLHDHPEILPIINPDVDRQVPTDIELAHEQLMVRGDVVHTLTAEFLHGIEAAPDVRQAAYDALVTPSLKAFWRETQTPAARRQRHVQGAYFHYVSAASDGYFAIPESDFDARDSYLAAHPEVTEFWAMNDRSSDDYKSVMASANASFREVYFRLVDRGDWSSADRYLAEHPYIFEFTSAEGRVNADGSWRPKSEAQRDFAAVAQQLHEYYLLHGSMAAGYLHSHPLLLRYLNKYSAPGGMREHAADYRAVAGMLAGYWSTAPGNRSSYLDEFPELKAYLAKYAADRTMSAHARAYLAVKDELDVFFSLPESERSDWLKRHGDVRAYFARYAGHSGGGVGYHAALRSALGEDPGIARRVEFWTRFLALPPDERERFIALKASDYGIFVYGSLGYDARIRAQEQWDARAVGFGFTEHAAEYRRVAPLLQVYFSLPKGSALRTLFLQVSPEVAAYLDKWAQPAGLVNDPHLLKLLEQYSHLQPYSQERADFITEHPALEQYWSEHESPKERALSAEVDRYFALPFEQREGWLAQHPEVKSYFDQRTAAHDRYSNLAAAFNSADPRMLEFERQYADIIPMDALKQFELQPKRPIYAGGARVDRAPEKAKSGSPRTAGTLSARRDRS
jgi:hypothetical protein